MKLDLEGRVAVVSAASAGLGFACAQRLAELGCDVAICARGEEALRQARDRIARRTGRTVYAQAADLMRPEDVEGFVDGVRERFGRADILVVNTGHIPYGGFDQLSDDDWYAAYDLIVMSAVRLVRSVLPMMRVRGGGDVVFITSIVAKEPVSHLLLSNVLRVGVVALAKSLSHELAPHGIRVNTVAPGYFETGRVKERIARLVETEGLSYREAVE